MRLILPHFPNYLDRIIYNWIKDFIVLPGQFSFIKVSEAEKRMNGKIMNKTSRNNKQFDMNSIFGLIRSGNLSMLKEFIEKNGIETINSLYDDGTTPVHWAAYEGTYEIFEYLMELNADYDNGANPAGHKPIHWACVKGRIDIVNDLLNKGVDINVADNKGFTPLITASQYGHVSLVCFLVSRGCKLEKEDVNGDNALHWAAYKGYPDLTRLLIIYGLSSKKIDSYGQTLLHLACLNGNLNIVQNLILQDNIDPEIRDKNGKKAIDLARTRGHSDIVNFIERHIQNRKNKYCNFKTFLFGPVGNSKFVFFIIHALYFIYEYPIYFLRVLPDTWNDHFELNLVYIFNNIFMWTSLYAVHLTEPGYLPGNTQEYQNYLRKITFRSQSFNAKEWNHHISRLCHTCKTVRPLRASHCRACNKCVLAYDHHCPYIQNCVGYKNRPYFFLFVVSMCSLQLVTIRFIYITLTNNLFQYIYYPGVLIVFLFAIMTIVLVYGALCSAVLNLTGNELSKIKKYEYLKDSNGNMKNIFSKGFWYNVRYYFHFVEPNHLETIGYEQLSNHQV